jgi:hypothetical protein
MTPEGAVDRFDEDATAGGNWDFINTLNVTWLRYNYSE